MQFNTHTHTFQSRETSLHPFLWFCFTRLQNTGAADGADRRKEGKTYKNNLNEIHQNIEGHSEPTCWQWTISDLSSTAGVLPVKEWSSSLPYVSAQVGDMTDVILQFIWTVSMMSLTHSCLHCYFCHIIKSSSETEPGSWHRQRSQVFILGHGTEGWLVYLSGSWSTIYMLGRVKHLKKWLHVADLEIGTERQI